MKQKTIGVNPLEGYLSHLQQHEENQSMQQTTEVKPNASLAEIAQDHIEKERITFHISAELINKLKNIVYWEPGLTLAALAEEGLNRMVEVMHAERGTPYPERKEHRLRGGRPIK